MCYVSLTDWQRQFSKLMPMIRMICSCTYHNYESIVQFVNQGLGVDLHIFDEAY